MKKILIINGGQTFAHSGGSYNKTITETTLAFFATQPQFEVQVTHIDQGYEVAEEITKWSWANVVIYHTPIWWFQLPNNFKKYLDEVLTAGHGIIYANDGRSSQNPAINYGTGGLLKNTQYMVTTSWNAPATAFTMEGEFFDQRSVDDGVLFGFHKMNAFNGMKSLPSFHFHDVEKNAAVTQDMARYTAHLETLFGC